MDKRIAVSVDGVHVCDCVLDKEKAKACQSLSEKLVNSRGRDSRPSSEQFEPLCVEVLGRESWERLVGIVGDGEDAAWVLCELWTRLAIESQSMRSEDVGRAAIRYASEDYVPTYPHVSPRSRPLTDCKPGKCVHVYDGTAVNDSAATFMRVMDLVKDDSLTDFERVEVLNSIVIADHGGFDHKRLSTVCWLAFGMDIDGTHANDGGHTVIDWYDDAGRIRSSLRMAFGFDWDDSASTTAFMDVCDMIRSLGECGVQTPLGQAMAARCPKTGQLSDAELAMRKHFAIRHEVSDPYGDDYLRGLNG